MYSFRAQFAFILKNRDLHCISEQNYIKFSNSETQYLEEKKARNLVPVAKGAIRIAIWQTRWFFEIFLVYWRLTTAIVTTGNLTTAPLHIRVIIIPCILCQREIQTCLVRGDAAHRRASFMPSSEGKPILTHEGRRGEALRVLARGIPREGKFTRVRSETSRQKPLVVRLYLERFSPSFDSFPAIQREKHISLSLTPPLLHAVHWTLPGPCLALLLWGGWSVHCCSCLPRSLQAACPSALPRCMGRRHSKHPHFLS